MHQVILPGPRRIFGGQDADQDYGNLADDVLYGNLGGDRLALNSLGGYLVGADASGNALISFSGGSVTLIGVDPANLRAHWIV